MTYKEYTDQEKAIQREEEAFSRKCGRKEIALRNKYVKEHQPMELKENQNIVVKLRVGEETRKHLTEDAKKKRRYQLGYTYTIKGSFQGWWIGHDGSVRPCLWRVKYGQRDEIVSIELDKYQPEGDCSKCRCYKEGLCYKAGGKNIGKSYATHKVKEGDIVCPRYEEIVEGGLWGKLTIWPHEYHPNVSIVRDEKGNKKYRLWNHDWWCYTEHDEEFINEYYSREPIDYGEEE